MAEPVRSEQRREHRQRVLKGAAILCDVNTSEIRCTLRNQSPNGAELRVPLGAEIPQEFLLYVPVDETGYRASVRWRLKDRVGVVFTGTVPKPHWHYG
jgi:hypothetical protein